MSIHNQTNKGRVAKITETLKLLHKSIAANKVDREDVWDLLEPIINQIDTMLGNEDMRAQQEQARAEDPGPVSTTKAPLYIQIREAAQTAPLKDLTWAMAVFLNRLDEALEGDTK